MIRGSVTGVLSSPKVADCAYGRRTRVLEASEEVRKSGCKEGPEMGGAKYTACAMGRRVGV